MNDSKPMRDLYSKIFQNGVNHVEAAKKLAEAQHFGYAISHLVLGIEELIKYQFMCYHFCDDPRFGGNEVNAIFSKHKSKHDLLKEFQSSISEEFAELLVQATVREITGQELKPEHIEARKNRFKEIGGFLGVAYKAISLTPDEKKEFFKWLENANALKNRGFYVDYNDGRWWFPEALTLKDYETGLKYASVIMAQTNVTKDLDITDDEFMEFLNQEVGPFKT